MLLSLCGKFIESIGYYDFAKKSEKNSVIVAFCFTGYNVDYCDMNNYTLNVSTFFVCMSPSYNLFNRFYVMCKNSLTDLYMCSFSVDTLANQNVVQ